MKPKGTVSKKYACLKLETQFYAFKHLERVKKILLIWNFQNTKLNKLKQSLRKNHKNGNSHN